jgi:hypothetical protein
MLLGLGIFDEVLANNVVCTKKFVNRFYVKALQYLYQSNKNPALHEVVVCLLSPDMVSVGLSRLHPPRQVHRIHFCGGTPTGQFCYLQ